MRRVQGRKEKGCVLNQLQKLKDVMPKNLKNKSREGWTDDKRILEFSELILCQRKQDMEVKKYYKRGLGLAK